MITDVSLHEYSLDIRRDSGFTTYMLNGKMPPPYRLEHWDSEKVVIISNEEYRYILNEYGNVISSERI